MTTDTPRPVLRGCTVANALLMLSFARSQDWVAVRFYLAELCRRPVEGEGCGEEAGADP